MNTLTAIAEKHKTDKVSHGYTPIYEQYLAPLRAKPVTILEIGVKSGASVRTWALSTSHILSPKW